MRFWPAPVIPNGIRANHTYDFIPNPFSSHSDFTLLGHLPAQVSIIRPNIWCGSWSAMRPAIELRNFPVTDYPISLTDLRIFEDFLPQSNND